MPKATKLGHYISEHRRAAGLSLEQLAELTHINKSSLSRIESGHIVAPAPQTLAELARILGVAVADLFALAGYATPNDLPGLGSFLRTRYGEVPDEVVRRIEMYLEIALADPDER